jgi:hypothetical protein
LPSEQFAKRTDNKMPLNIAEKRMVILGFTGHIGSGKSTASEYLVNQYDFEKYAFALPIKNVAIAMGFSHRELYGTQEEKLSINEYWNVSGRTFMQKFGTEIGRAVLPKIIPDMNFGKYNSPWIRLFEIYVAEKNKDKTVESIVVEDVRFNNEAKVIREHGGYIIRIIRPDDHYSIYKNHASETEMDGITADFTIINDGSLRQLEDKIDDLIFK